MIYLRYIKLAFASISLTIIGVFVVPLLLLYVGPLAPLPKWASWFDNDIEPLGDYSRKPAILAATGLKRIWLRYVWLGWRNPANNFGVAMAVNRVASDTLEKTGNQLTSDQGEQGWKLNKLMNGERVVAFEYYYIKAYKLFGSRCLRVRLGWKLDDSPARLVCVVNPLMTFTGKWQPNET
jgi:hypothetical protein